MGLQRELSINLIVPSRSLSESSLDGGTHGESLRREGEGCWGFIRGRNALSVHTLLYESPHAKALFMVLPRLEAGLEQGRKGPNLRVACFEPTYFSALTNLSVS